MRENEALDFYSLEVWLFERLWDFQNNHKEKKGKANVIVDFFCREIFSWVSKVILDCFRFAYYALWSVWKNSQHYLNQSNVTRKPTYVFPRFSQVARVRTCVVIGSCDTTLIWKLSLDEIISQNRQNSNTCY